MHLDTLRPRTRLLPLVLVLLLPGHARPAGAQALRPHARSALESTVDTTIRPGDDFFAYANGAWLRATTIPAGSERWGARDEIRELTRRRVAGLVDRAATAPRGSAARKVGDYRAAWLDEKAIEASGLSSIQAELDDIGRIRDRLALTRWLGRTMPADVDPLNLGVYRSSAVLGFAVERSIHGEKTYDVFLVQGGLGLGDREQYLGADAGLQSLRAGYRQYIGRMLSLAGLDRADERADRVLALETALAKTQATAAASANDHNADSSWTRADLTREAPGMDWTVFLDAAGLGSQQTFGVWQPGAVRGLAALVGSEPIDAWQDYLRFQRLDHYAGALPRRFAEAALALPEGAKRAAAETPRDRRALDATQAALPGAIGRMYAEQYFPAAQKARIRRIVASVGEAFAGRVAALTWMSPASRSLALARLRTLYIGIGYPEQWEDYSDLVIDPTDALGNLRRVEARARRRALARVGRAVDFHEWWMPPQWPGAVLIFQQNAYEFSAALLQPPKFDAAASDAAAYGAIGAIIGHDISHYVDLLGAEYDTTYALRRWWTDADMDGFKTRAEPLAAQFSAYHPFTDLGVDGRLTLLENVADLAGLDASFEAYRRAVGAARTRAGDREFFIAFAQGWRTRIGETALRKQLATNDHAPEMFRVSTVRNLDAWYDAFDVTPGQRLYLAPAARVHVW